MADEQKPQDAAGAAADGQAPPAASQAVPQDALEKTNEELGEAAAGQTPVPSTPDGKPAKQPSALKKFLKKFNLYLLLFALVVLVGVVVTVVAYLNSKKAPKEPSIATKQLTQADLKQLANSDATVGDTGQTLTVQGNAIFSGQVLVRSNLNVAGTIQLGGEFDVPELVVSNTANLNSTQVSSLQVSQGSTFQGLVTVQNGLNVGGSTAFSGPVTAGQITVTKLIMSGNASLEIPNHLNFTGASPGRTISPSVLGVGGSASINGSDVTGTININSGSGPTAGCFMNVTFNRPFTNTPHVLISPVDAAAGQTEYYVTRNTTGFSLCTNNAAPANQVFAFDYFITGT
jgi:cytoskeletal protein CcmA (bactofilin family)